MVCSFHRVTFFCAEDLETLWKKLYDQFLAEHVPQPTHSGQHAPVEITQWAYYRDLTFLSSSVDPRPIASSMQIRESFHNNNSTLVEPAPDNFSKSKKSKVDEVDKALISLSKSLERHSDALVQQQNQSSTTRDDEDAIFGETVAKAYESIEDDDKFEGLLFVLSRIDKMKQAIANDQDFANL